MEFWKPEGPHGAGEDASKRANWHEGRFEGRRKLRYHFIHKRKVALEGALEERDSEFTLSMNSIFEKRIHL